MHPANERRQIVMSSPLAGRMHKMINVIQSHMIQFQTQYLHFSKSYVHHILQRHCDLHYIQFLNVIPEFSTVLIFTCFFIKKLDTMKDNDGLACGQV